MYCINKYKPFIFFSIQTICVPFYTLIKIKHSDNLQAPAEQRLNYWNISCLMFETP